ncbi:MAG TPA: phosphatase PAP2 family protein [Solirubrobacteraceae bacterium]|nr:phosphatase PAP2 family protein [Solirubrobacteraceae bacterium]
MSEHAHRAGATFVSGVAPQLGGRRPDRRGGAARWLGVAALCLAALVATWCASALVAGVRFKDAVALHDFTLLNRPHVDTVANALLKLLEPAPFTVLAVALVAVAVARKRPRLAVAVAAVSALAPLSCELLKPLLAHGHDQLPGAYIADASWPSGHATAAVVLALCALLVCPRHLRVLVGAIGACFVLAVGCSLLILAWHMPSDVIGGYLLGALWVALAVAALRIRGPGRRDLRPTAARA